MSNAVQAGYMAGLKDEGKEGNFGSEGVISEADIKYYCRHLKNARACARALVSKNSFLKQK